MDADVSQAKLYLQQQSDKTGINLYDHLTELISELLEKKPKNPADVFENVSSQVKRSKFNLESLHAPLGFKSKPPPQAGLLQVNKILSVLQNAKKPEEGSEETAGQLPDILDVAGLFEWAGVSFGKEETFLLALSIQQLVQEKGLQSARFWGRIQGTRASYYILEGEGGSAEEDDPLPDGEKKAEGSGAAGLSVELPEFEGYPAPKKAPQVNLPKEEGTGCNKYTYFVCTGVGEKWVRLPDVTPEQIAAARKIRKFFTGDLSTPIVSHPAFSGTEANYLRAQIARITASTVVCPQGYYVFDPEQADEEHPESNMAIIVNTDYETLPNEALLSLENWVHQVPYLLPQGRTTWVNPTPPKNEDDEEDSEGNENDQPNEDDNTGEATGGETEHEIEPETGPALLTSLSEDAEHGGHPAWSVRACSRLQPARFSPIHLRSNRWPGAHAVYYNGKFSCIYVGDGHKDLAGSLFSVPKLPALQSEWKPKEGGPDVIEQTDPTVEAEKKFEEMLKEQQDDAQPDEDDGQEEGGDQ